MANGGESTASKIFVGLVVTVGGGLVLAFLIGQLGLNGGGGRGGTNGTPVVDPTVYRTPGVTPANQPVTNPPAPTSKPTHGAPVAGCVLTITFPFAELYQEPRHDATRVGDVPEGQYPSSNSTISNWAGKDERWFEITASGRTGWIVDDGIQVDSKSADCQ
jgi:hypothetical protein